MKHIYLTFLILFIPDLGLANENEIALLPSASIAGTTTVCQNATGIVITFTGSNGIGNYTFTYSLNGVSQTPVSTSGNNNSVTVPVNTTVAGIFTFSLISVEDNSGTQNINNQNAVVTVISGFSVNAGTDIKVCKGNPINLTSSVIGNGSNSVLYSWSGPNGFSSNQQSPTRNNSTVLMSGNYIVTASIGNCQVQDVVNVEVLNVGVTNPSTLNACLTTGQTSAQVGLILSLPTSASLIQTITINWGDSSSPQVIPSTNWTTPIVYTYPSGSYTVTITATTSIGCTITQTYIAFIGSSPQAATLSLFANQAIGCSPHTTNFTFGIPISNSDGTNYLICFGDNAASCITYVDGTQIPSNWVFSGTAAGFNLYTITHIYNITSCGNSVNLNGTTYNNVFLPSVITTNPCTAPQPQAGSLISVGLSPTAIFTPNPIPNICVNTPLILTNTSNFGGTIDPITYSCTTTSPFFWTITPSTAGLWTATGLGSNNGFPTNELFWTSGSMTPSITFNQPGNYTITLNVKNSCGINSISHTVCVEPPLTPQFTLNTTDGCAPLAITATNTTSLINQCATPTYLWQVTHTPLYCASSTVTIPNQTTSNANFNFTESGTYLIRLTVTNSCGSVTSPVQTVTVKKPPTVSITNIADFCQSASLTPLASVGSCTNTTPTYLWSFPGGTPSSATSQTAPSVTYAIAGNYTVSLAVTNECGTATAVSNSFAVQSAPTVQNETITVCGGVAFSVSPSNSTAGNTIPVGTTYSWPIPIVTGGMTGGVSGTNQTVISGTLNNSTSSVQTATYTITPKIGTCSGATFTVIVTVNPAAQVNQPIDVSVCNGATTSAVNFTTTNPSGTTFSWTNSTPSIGLAASGNGNVPSFIAVNTTNSPILATIIVTPSFSGGSATCSGVPKTFTITVNPTGEVNQPSNLIKCNGEVVSIPFSTSNSGGTTIYNWTNDTVAIGLAATGTGNISFTATNSTSTPLVATINVIPTYNNGSSICTGTSKTFTITINPSAQVNQPHSISVCNGNIVPTTTFSTLNTSGTTSYTWTNSNTAIGLSATGTGDIPAFTAINTGNSVLTATIIVTPSYLVGATSCTGSTKQFTITVSPNANVNATTDKIICNGSSLPSISFSSTNTGGTTSYSWTNDTPSIGLIASGTGNIPTFMAVNTGLVPVTATISVTPSFTNGSLVCSGVTQTFTITVNPSAQVNSINNIEVCNGNSIPSIVFSTNNPGGITTYSWTNSNISIGLAASGNGNIPTFTANNTGSTPLIATITVTPTYTNTGVNCSGTSQTFTITVNPSPTGVISGTVDVCLNASNPLITFTGSAGNPPYIFTYTINNGSNQTISTTSGNSISINAPTNVLGIFTYNLINVQDSNATSCLNTISQSATVTVTAAPLIDVPPTPTQSICVGGTIQNPLTVTYINGTGTPTYQWYSNTSSSTTGGTAVGTNSPSYLPSVYTVSGTYYYYVIISFSGSGCGSVTSAVAEIVVVSDPIVSTQPIATQTLCQNATASALTVVTSGGIGTYSYQWYSNTSNSTSGGTLINGAVTDTYMPSTSNAGTIYYYCEITQPNGIGCNVSSEISEVNVNIAPTILNNPSSSTVCLGNNPTLLSVSYLNGVGTPNYQWYSNTISANTGGTLIFGATNATYNPPATSTGTTFYYCEVTFPAISGSCSLIVSNPAEVTINPNPVIAPETTTICSSTTFTITPNTASGNIIPLGTTYSWSNPAIAPAGSITGASAQNNPQTNISQTLVNSTTSPATVTYTVTPISGVCTGDNFTVTITVNPAINPNVVANNNTCFGVNTASITTNITGGIPPYTINWTGPNGFTAATTSIANLLPGLYNVTIDDLGGCPFSNSYTIIEPADIVITVDSESDSTCFGSNNGSINISITGGTGSYFYTWTKNNIPFAITQDISSLAPGTYVVSVTDANNCGPKTETFTITEPPLLVVSLVSQTNVLCFGAATGAISVNTVGGTPNPTTLDYIYAWTGPNGFISNNQNLNSIIAGTYNLTVTDNQGCSKNLTVVITQSSEIIVSFTTTPITCFGANNASITVTISGGNAPYQFQWNNLATTLNQTNLSAGTYTITVTDNVGCSKVQNIIIPEAPLFTVNPIVTNVTCFGANNGSINLNLTGGIAPVALTWSDGSTAGLIRNNLPPGTYTATISDGTPCFIVRTFTIIQPQPLVVAANISNPLDCNTANNGSINLIVSGGTSPFNYNWSNGATTEDLFNLNAGNYFVTVTDSNNCVITGQYNLVRPAPIQIAVTTQTDFDCATREVTQNFVAQASGGIPPYQYQWSSGTVSGANNQIMNSTVNGTVILTVTDSASCTANYTVDVDNPVIGNASFEATSFGYATYGIYSIGDPIQFNSTITGDYLSVRWDFGDGTFSTELNPVHTYQIPRDYIVTQTVTYPFGCIYVQTISLLVEKGYLLVVPTAFTPNRDALNDTYRPVTKRLKDVQLDIYDTWGSLIYSEKGDVLVGWDGTIKGFNAENGNYYSKVRAETFYGTVVNENQTFVLIK